MFSGRFLRYLLSYEPAGFEQKDYLKTEKEIPFKQIKNGIVEKVYITVEK